jgi:hypothetical protein
MYYGNPSQSRLSKNTATDNFIRQRKVHCDGRMVGIPGKLISQLTRDDHVVVPAAIQRIVVLGRDLEVVIEQNSVLITGIVCSIFRGA